MFEEHTVIALTEPIGLERIEDIPPDSPLLAADNPGDGLRPGDVGTIVAAFPRSWEVPGGVCGSGRLYRRPG